MKILAIFALMTCCFGQQKKPAKPSLAPSGLYTCPPNDCSIVTYTPQPYAHWDEGVKEGTYTFSFTDPNNKWRCYFTSNSGEQATIVCVKPHDVKIEGGK